MSEGLLAAEWRSLAVILLEHGSLVEDLPDARLAFFAGAHHVWKLMTPVLAAGLASGFVAASDEDRADRIDDELRAWVEACFSGAESESE